MLPRSGSSCLPLLLLAFGISVFLFQNHRIIEGLGSIRDQLAKNADIQISAPQPQPLPLISTVQEPVAEAKDEVKRKEEQEQKIEEPQSDISVYSLEKVANAGSTKQGYDNRFVTPERNGIDSQLFDRIVLHQQVYPQPLFKLKKQGNAVPRHDWQFEKIIHQTWIDEQIPGRTAPWVRKWLETHPDWTYMFWTDKAAADFINEHYPSLLTAYDSYNIPVQRADMFRYIVLYAFGGVYADLDMEVLKNLDEIRNWSSCILSREPELQTFVMSNFMNCWGNNWTFACNAFMACRSHHPFMHYVISRVVHWSPYILKRPCALSATIACTGPWMMSFAYSFYRRSVPEELRKKRREIDVNCPQSEYFLPTFDESRLKLVQRNCASTKLDQKQKDICAKYIEGGSKNEPLPYSYTTHHWFHSYHNDVNKDKVDVRTLTKVLQWSHDTQDTDFEITYIDG